jgi:arsenate reductase
MAEGWARKLKSGTLEAFSAGTAPQAINRLAVKVMQEVGVDISGQSSKHVDSLKEIPFDLVITVCDSAKEACPVFPKRVRTLHMSFEDPPKLAIAAKSDQEALPQYRRVRDEIKSFITTLPGGL